ncbi:MAG: DUF2817 domain-containing protein, partial [Leptospira sp.]|nr:DUF2817 domain-containing protein [Leptospira sp.]
MHSLPIKHITLKENFQKVQISKKDYYSKIPTGDIFEIIRLAEDYSSIQFLIPMEIYVKWRDLKIPFQQLPYPTKFSEIDPSFDKRLKNGCIPLKSMLNGYKTSALNQLYLHCIEKEFPDIAKRFHIGRSVQNRKITALRIRLPHNRESKSERNPILFHCGIHGNEMIAIEHCYDIIQQTILNSKKYQNLETTEIWVIPILNPDGLDSHWFQTIHTGRTNARNIDLNRNFPFLWNSGIERASSGNPKSPYFRGFQAGSEPEVQAVLKLMETKRFFFSMSIHCYANSVLIPYSIPDTKNPRPNILQELGEKLIQNVNSQR